MSNYENYTRKFLRPSQRKRRRPEKPTAAVCTFSREPFYSAITTLKKRYPPAGFAQ